MSDRKTAQLVIGMLREAQASCALDGQTFSAADFPEHANPECANCAFTDELLTILLESIAHDR